MIMQDVIRSLVQKNDTKIFMFVLDGVGGLPVQGTTELEAAKTPNLDALAHTSACGLHIPVGYGITPGSGPGHLGIFGYDPLQWQIGRGVLEALGVGMELRDTDVALRCNYSTLAEGLIKDRRAGRIPTELNRELTKRLQNNIQQIDEAEVIFESGMEHRFAVVIRFPEPLEQGSAQINDTDPQNTGKAPIPLKPGNHQSERTARIAEKLIIQASDLLSDQDRANYILLRGFAQVPDIPTFEDAFGLKSLAIATYPMYRGLARLIGMDTPVVNGDIKEEVEYLKNNLRDYDFFFIHIKKTDSNGEDGNFEGKTAKITEFDGYLPEILEMDPDVLIVTGDHSTPSLMKEHSWHPVPLLLKSPYVLGRLSERFTERECTKGELGILPAVNILPLALANTGRLKKYGA
jgi:2,3-bisphosphoglycerate-independent phosphoglycerate mutase